MPFGMRTPLRSLSLVLVSRTGKSALFQLRRMQHTDFPRATSKPNWGRARVDQSRAAPKAASDASEASLEAQGEPEAQSGNWGRENRKLCETVKLSMSEVKTRSKQCTRSGDVLCTLTRSKNERQN